MKESMHRLRRLSTQMPRRFWYGGLTRLWLEINARTVRWNIRRRLGLKRKWRCR